MSKQLSDSSRQRLIYEITWQEGKECPWVLGVIELLSCPGISTSQVNRFISEQRALREFNICRFGVPYCLDTGGGGVSKK